MQLLTYRIQTTNPYRKENLPRAKAYGKFKGQRIQDAGCIIDRIVNDGFTNVKTVLDIGCADGLVTQELSHLIPEARIHALDIDPAMIDLANELDKVDKIKYILQDITVVWDDLDPELQALEDKVDLIFCNYVMNWIKPKDRPQAMRNISRLVFAAYFSVG
ncbi:unnamed protein product [Allacma fusca]|uniref:Methyltransferase domain-containing protein n=1 Tax=Allacma fusca TaxID=39272 RepID=A0A8J2KF20_9HEXA|nr:unnamed protein product [Allacma fusca]